MFWLDTPSLITRRIQPRMMRSLVRARKMVARAIQILGNGNNNHNNNKRKKLREAQILLLIPILASRISVGMVILESLIQVIALVIMRKLSKGRVRSTVPVDGKPANHSWENCFIMQEFKNQAYSGSQQWRWQRRIPRSSRQPAAQEPASQEPAFRITSLEPGSKGRAAQDSGFQGAGNNGGGNQRAAQGTSPPGKSVRVSE